MDFNRCFEILQEHSCQSTTCACAFKENPQQAILSSNDEESLSSGRLFRKILHDNDFQGDFINKYDNVNSQIMSDMELIKDLLYFQGKRVVAYRLYEEEFQNILSTRELQKYSLLCMEITGVFSFISKCIIKIKNVCEAREQLKDVTLAITTIQAAEKEKLTFVAADHLDRMQEQLPQLASMTGGVSTHQRDYLMKKIQENENTVRDAIENINSVKADLVDA